MDGVLLRVSVAVLAVSFGAWVLLSLVVLVGRARYDWITQASGSEGLSPGAARRLVRLASGRPRTDWGRWRRASALTRLARAHHPATPRLLRRLLAEPDARVSAAAIRALGDLGDHWAVDVLLRAMCDGNAPRSRIATELERLAPLPGPRLLELLRHWNPAVRFWGATLLGPYPTLGETQLLTVSRDHDPDVRAAAVETLGTRSGGAVEAALLARLEDPVWFVRVHAARSAGHVVGAPAAAAIAALLPDSRWWVRTAAKDALRGIGAPAIPALLALLGHEDGFARNGAAEVLQDLGFVDELALDDPASPLLARIYAAGGPRMREAAETRARARGDRRAEAA
jgi:HEAT repeat protein